MESNAADPRISNFEAHSGVQNLMATPTVVCRLDLPGSAQPAVPLPDAGEELLDEEEELLDDEEEEEGLLDDEEEERGEGEGPLDDQEPVTIPLAAGDKQDEPEGRIPLSDWNVAALDYARSFPERYREVVLALAWHTNLESRTVRASYATLQRWISEDLHRMNSFEGPIPIAPSERTLSRYVNELKELGILQTWQRSGAHIKSRRGYEYRHPKSFASNTWQLEFNKTIDHKGEVVVYDFPYPCPDQSGSNLADAEAAQQAGHQASAQSCEPPVERTGGLADSTSSITTPITTSYDVTKRTSKSLNAYRRPQTQRATRGVESPPHSRLADYSWRRGEIPEWPDDDPRWDTWILEDTAQWIAEKIASRWPQARVPRVKLLRQVLHDLYQDGYTTKEIGDGFGLWLWSIDPGKPLKNPAGLFVSELPDVMAKRDGWDDDYSVRDLLDFVRSGSASQPIEEVTRAIDFYVHFGDTWSPDVDSRIVEAIDKIVNRSTFYSAVVSQWEKAKQTVRDLHLHPTPR